MKLRSTAAIAVIGAVTVASLAVGYELGNQQASASGSDQRGKSNLIQIHELASAFRQPVTWDTSQPHIVASTATTITVTGKNSFVIVTSEGYEGDLVYFDSLSQGSPTASASLTPVLQNAAGSWITLTASNTPVNSAGDYVSPSLPAGTYTVGLSAILSIQSGWDLSHLQYDVSPNFYKIERVKG
jgi:hypothetical protein